MMTFTESRMKFGPFDPERCFYVEKSDLYKNSGGGVKIAEFILLQGDPITGSLAIVEAKSSSPRPNNSGSLDVYREEIAEKFMNTIQLVAASFLGRHQKYRAEMPARFLAQPGLPQHLKFVLIINGHKEEWLKSLQDLFQYRLSTICRCWGYPKESVLVINEVIAKEYKLISGIDLE